MQILIASSNPHKIDEIRDIAREARANGAEPANLTFFGLGDMDVTVEEPVEDQATFLGNATLKARHYSAATEMVCLADDSGLVVDALGGEPGVHSARFADVAGPREVRDLANNKLLLERLGDLPSEKRTARFVCVMALCDAEKTLATAHGKVEGRIITAAEARDPSQPHLGVGDHGFGYDPLFFLPDLGKTSAQLPPAQKNALSHRGAAMREMLKRLAELP